MATLIETSLWIDFTRARSTKNLKQFIAPFILHPDALLAEPVACEVLRHATPAEFSQLTQQFQTLPMLATPADLRTSAAIQQAAEIVTFDPELQEIASVSPLQVKLLTRPTP